MSRRSVFIGLLIGCGLLTIGLAGVWYFDWPSQLMPSALIAIAVVVGACVGWIQRRRAFQSYWQRGCLGIRWRRQFPNDSKAAIRRFLIGFTDAFAFSDRIRHRLSPDDRVMELYHALYPPGTLADNMELERLAIDMQERYGIDLRSVWRDDITLGDLYAWSKTAKG